MQRHIFAIDTDTGTQGDTGIPFVGEVMQMRWAPTTADTGGDLQVGLLPRQDDTGDGWLFYNDNDVLGSDFVRVPRQPGYAADGTDTGVDEYHPIVADGDRLRVKVIPGGSAVVGRLYIWTKPT